MTTTNFWGNSPVKTTVEASPSPTQTVFTLSDATDFLEGQYIFVQVDGDLERTRITAKAADALTVSPALSAAPDVPGEVQSGRELITNARLNAGGLFNAESVAELAAVDTTLASDGLKYFIKNVGMYRFAFASTATADNFMVIAPETGPGRWLLETTANLWQIEADGPSSGTDMSPPAEGISWGSMFQRSQLQKLELETVRNGSHLFQTESERPQIYIDGRWYAFMLERADYDLDGTVTNTLSGAAESGVTITIDDTQQQDISDGSGAYAIANAPKGTAVALIATKSGYNTYTGTVNLNTANATKNFTIARRTISGTVTSSGGGAISGATVQIASPSRSDTTDGSGNYELIDVPDGSYTVTASHTDHSSYTSGTVTVSGNTDHDFTMNVLPATVTGTVTSSVTSGTIVGASVTVDSEPAVTTNGSGIYSRSGVQRLTGRSVAASYSPWFSAYSGSVDVSADPTTKNFSMVPTDQPHLNFGGMSWNFANSGYTYGLQLGIKLVVTKSVVATGVRIWNTSNFHYYQGTAYLYNNSDSVLASTAFYVWGDQTVNFSSPVTLTPGTYWLGLGYSGGGLNGGPVQSNWLGTSNLTSHHPYVEVVPNMYGHPSNASAAPSSWTLLNNGYTLSLAVQVQM